MTTDTQPMTDLRIARVLDGLLVRVQNDELRGNITKLTGDMDAIGRLDVKRDNSPMLDRYSFRMMLASSLSTVQVESIIGSLDRQEDVAFRKDNQLTPVPLEIPWYALAEHVTIFDPTPGAAFTALPPVGQEQLKQTDFYPVMEAIIARFPSLEPELIDPRVLPQRLEGLWKHDRWQSWMAIVARQLGWWAGATAALMAAQALGAKSDNDKAVAAMSWPLAMYVLAAAIGGWTLTVVGDCALGIRI